ncbi:MAG: hypothetical protein OHK93_007762 [Ramalina farinacea]|uniref:DUF1996 domain-containing protein n=1 Tax=Ramalina farinacea TaxID=258253 RepID=A0AA43QL51_9LECA|nr:hypothetical protein [Ramalina farinacea]
MALGQSPSNHVHEIYGGDAFKADWDYTTAQSSKCNNMGPKVDHSNYWFPAMYFHGADDTYTKVPPHLEIYYHFDTADNGPRTMFPNGFKMISGNAMLRHDDSATDLATKSIRWYCHGPEKVSVGSFPEAVTSCPGSDGFSGEIWFPFCWDGSEDFDPSDPYAHVVFGDGDSPQGGKCSGNHTKALPQLFMEFHHDVSAFASKSQAAVPWVLAQGDGTGYGMHADFINGWEDGEGSLKDAIALDPSDTSGVKTKCYVGESGAGAAACFELLSNDEMYNCNMTATTGDSDVVGPLPSLPGCNPIQPGPADATIQTNCAGHTAPTSETKDTVPAAGQSSNDAASPSTQVTTNPATSSSASPSSSSSSMSSSTTTTTTTTSNTNNSTTAGAPPPASPSPTAPPGPTPAATPTSPRTAASAPSAPGAPATQASTARTTASRPASRSPARSTGASASAATKWSRRRSWMMTSAICNVWEGRGCAGAVGR